MLRSTPAISLKHLQSTLPVEQTTLSNVDNSVTAQQTGVNPGDAYQLAVAAGDQAGLNVRALFAHLGITSEMSVETARQVLLAKAGCLNGGAVITINEKITITFEQTLQILLLFNQACECCHCNHVKDPPPKSHVKPMPLDITFAGYGQFVAPQAPARDPLVVRMNGLLPGASVEVRNRSRGIGPEPGPRWMKVDIGDLSKRVDIKTGAAELVFTEDALRKLGIRSNDQVEIRQKTQDGRTSDEKLLPLSTDPSSVRLPERPAGMVSVQIGADRVSGVFEGLEDITNPKVDPSKLDVGFEGNNLRVQVQLNQGHHAREFAQFCEPRSQVMLWNTTTDQKSAPVTVKDDGTLDVSVPGKSSDGFALVLVDQSGKFNQPRDLVIVALSEDKCHRPVPPNPTNSVLAAPYGLDLDGLHACHDTIHLKHAVPRGSLVTLFDSETRQSVRLLADDHGSVNLPAEVMRNRVYELTVESPYVAGLDDKAANQISPRLRTRMQFTVDKDFNVNVDPACVHGTDIHGGADCALDARHHAGVNHLEGFTLSNAKVWYNRNGYGEPRQEMVLFLDVDPKLEINRYGAPFTASPTFSADGNTMQVAMTPQPSMHGTWLPAGEKLAPESAKAFDFHFPNITFPDRKPGDLKPFILEVVAPDGRVAQRASFVPEWTPVAGQGFQLKGWKMVHLDKVDEPAKVLLNEPAKKLNQIGVHANMISVVAGANPMEPNPAVVQAVRSGTPMGEPTLIIDLDWLPPDIQNVRMINRTARDAGVKSFTYEKPLEVVDRVEFNQPPRHDVATLTFTGQELQKLGAVVGDELEVQVQDKHGNWTEVSTTSIESHATVSMLRRASTDPNDFVSAGVMTYWKQVDVGEVCSDTINFVKDGKRCQKSVVATPIAPRPREHNWARVVKFEEVTTTDKDGHTVKTVVGRLPGSAVPPFNPQYGGRALAWSSYGLKSPYPNSTSLYSLTSGQTPLQRQVDGSYAFCLPSLGPDCVYVLKMNGSETTYPPELATHPSVKASYPNIMTA